MTEELVKIKVGEKECFVKLVMCSEDGCSSPLDADLASVYLAMEEGLNDRELKILFPDLF